VCELTGVKTLDPKDPDYRPNYNNDDGSSDYHMANGFSYHQGPVRTCPTPTPPRVR
jgi:glycogen debranching enzyme